jgi:hypothetical protein
MGPGFSDRTFEFCYNAKYRIMYSFYIICKVDHAALGSLTRTGRVRLESEHGR